MLDRSRLLSLLLVLVMLGSVISPVMAKTEVSETSQILLKRIVVAKLDGKKLLLNTTWVNRMIILNESCNFTTMVNVDPRDDKSQPVADVIFFENKTTLADHYRLVGKVLNNIRKKDNTSWIWNKVRVELNDSARKVERDLPEYNIKGFGSVWVVDDVQ